MRNTTKVRLTATGVAVSLALIVAGGASSAQAASTVRVGPYADSYNCERYRLAAIQEAFVERIGACYQLGPGAAGWYFNKTYPI